MDCFVKSWHGNDLRRAETVPLGRAQRPLAGLGQYQFLARGEVAVRGPGGPQDIETWKETITETEYERDA